MGNGISCCCRNTQDNNIKQEDKPQEHLERKKITPTLVKHHSIPFSNTIEHISKEPTIKQVHSELWHSPNLYHKPTRTFSNTTSIVAANKDIQRTHLPHKMKSASKMKCPRFIANSISPTKKNSVDKKPIQKSSSQVEINMLQKYNQIMNCKLNEFSQKMNSDNNNVSSYHKSHSQKLCININENSNNNNNEVSKGYTKVDTETFSSNQISFIKRILSEEELIFEQMDEIIK